MKTKKSKNFFANFYHNLSSLLFSLKAEKVPPRAELSAQLIERGYEDIDRIFSGLQTNQNGLPHYEIAKRRKKYGQNEIIQEPRDNWLVRLLMAFSNPLMILLLVLVAISILTRDNTTAAIISIMVLVSVTLRYHQENQAYNAAEALRSMVKTTCTVVRDGKVKEIDLSEVVVGDIVQLSAGDIVPADARIISSRELFINQSSITGEALPAEKHANIPPEKIKNPMELQNLCFAGTSVESGTARAVILAVGGETYFGNIAKSIIGEREITSFDRGVDKFTWLMIWFMAVMTPLVFLINGFVKHNWLEAFFFAVAVAVGLTPEMLPAIVTVNLSKGAIVMSKNKVIVKRLSAIQNFGAMNILCTDKTGTLTQNNIVLIENIDINGQEDPGVLHQAYLNSYYQTGFTNLLDDAVLKRGEKKKIKNIIAENEKVDELPFDFVRKRLSVIVKDKHGHKTLICKGAVEEVIKICTSYEVNKKVEPLSAAEMLKAKALDENLSGQGYRVIALAYKHFSDNRIHYSNKDEHSLTLLGFMTFFDPPKESAAQAIAELTGRGVEVKILTGDNELVTKKICDEVGLVVKGVLLGSQIEDMDEAKLEQMAETVNIFAKLSPEHKKRIVDALQKKQHVVGYLGDGINDAPALRAADVGISVNGAVDIAKESADIILLELSLLVLEEGVLEGRRVFGNIVKYIKMGASSNFGNMFSVLGASIFLPFLPMAPLQLITNNLLYDLSQTAIPTDNVDREYIEQPKKWNIGDIKRFMLYIGPLSSIFDYVTFGVMIFVFNALSNPPLFQTGWFVESLLTQTLIVHVIRSRRIPFVQTWASASLTVTTGLIMAAGIYLVYSPIAGYLKFASLPMLYWPILIVILISYLTLTQAIKTWYISQFGYN